MKRQILIVEDNRTIAASYARRLYIGGLGTYYAPTIPGAQSLFTANRNTLAGIIMDSGVPGEDLNTLGLIAWLRSSGFVGRIIAASNSSNYREQMVSAGCSQGMSKPELFRSLPGVFS